MKPVNSILLMLIASLLIAACGSLSLVLEGPATPSAEASAVAAPVLEAPQQAQPTQTSGTEEGAKPMVEHESLDCYNPPGPTPGSVEYLACNVQASLTSGNTQPLSGFMADPIILAYWRSEGQSLSPAEAFDRITNSLLPADPSKLQFTTDRAQFPSLEGQPLEGIFGPDLNIALIVFSQGWGQDGAGEALLYFTQGSDGSYQWSALLISNGPF
jgi:hypothetical protein